MIQLIYVAFKAAYLDLTNQPLRNWNPNLHFFSVLAGYCQPRPTLVRLMIHHPHSHTVGAEEFWWECWGGYSVVSFGLGFCGFILRLLNQVCTRITICYNVELTVIKYTEYSEFNYTAIKLYLNPTSRHIRNLGQRTISVSSLLLHLARLAH
jgi:hypothetical protein